MLLWRHQRSLAIGYVLVLILGWIFFLALSRYMPASVDIGSVLAVRALAYEDTFDVVRTAEKEMADGKVNSAAIRLQRFVDQHADVQPTTLYASSVSSAQELLIQAYLAKGSIGKAEKTAETWTQLLPRNYRAWYWLGKVRKQRGDFTGAADAMSQAFKLTLCIPEIADSYLSILADLNQYERILWVAQQYKRAEKTARPRVEVFVGLDRSSTQRTVMQLVDLAVGHGKYFAKFSVKMNRGLATIDFPKEIFGNSGANGKFYALLKVENVFDDLEILSIELQGKDGKWVALGNADYEVGILKQEHSGAVRCAELKTDWELEDVSGCRIQVSSPGYGLSGDSERIIQRAQTNSE